MTQTVKVTLEPKMFDEHTGQPLEFLIEAADESGPSAGAGSGEVALDASGDRRAVCLGHAVLTTERAVLIRYVRDGKLWRGSGLRVGGRFVLTADHCANGTAHRVAAGGREYQARVHVRSDHPVVDLAVLEVPTLVELETVGCARVDRTVAGDLQGCRALGFPIWKDSADGPRLAQVDGNVPTAEGVDPHASVEVVSPLTLKITNQQVRERPVPGGDLDQPGSQWAGMSGAVVVTGDGLVVGVVRSHSPAEGMASLTLTPVEAIAGPPAAARFLAALQLPDPQEWPTCPLPVEVSIGGSLAPGQVVVGEDHVDWPVRVGRPPPLAEAFQERPDLRGAIDGALSSGSVAVVTQILAGDGGTSKTQLASAAYRRVTNSGIDLALWVAATSHDSVISAYAWAARLLHLPPAGDANADAEVFFAWLTETPRQWLVVLDDVTDPADLRGLWPEGRSGRVIVTTRRRDASRTAGQLAAVVDVGVYTPKEAGDYLTEKLGAMPGALEGAAELTSNWAIFRSPLLKPQQSSPTMP